MTDTYFIGYDAREHIAAGVCTHSILWRSTRPAQVFMVEHQTLRRLGLFHREWRVNRTGQFYDLGDGKPFSTAFSHSRFLVFELAKRMSLTGPCMFVDCDFLFQMDPAGLMAQQEKRPDEIGVVMRDRQVDEGSLKMDGMLQQNYSRKLWSAMFTFMPSDEWADLFTPAAVNEATGRQLHGFLGLPDDRFWSVSPSWHHIPSLDEPEGDIPNAIHYSEFSPWLNPERHSEFWDSFDVWDEELSRYLKWCNDCGRTENWSSLEESLAPAAASP